MQQMYDIPGEMPPCCVAVGHFEGVHEGHKALARQLAADAKAHNLSSVLVSLYDPDGTTLTSELEKALLFQECGVDRMISIEMSYIYRAMSPATFTQLILKNRLNARRAVAGADHADCYPGLETVSIPMFCQNGQPLSTGQLRSAFADGDMDRYIALSGHPFVALGTIGHGCQRGRNVGMPTANLDLPHFKRCPPEGVYATVSTINGEVYMGLTNVGRRPTVDSSNTITVETNLLDVDRDLYGETQLLEFYLYVRGVEKFDDLSQVKAQVDRDYAQVRDRLSAIVAQRRAV